MLGRPEPLHDAAAAASWRVQHRRGRGRQRAARPPRCAAAFERTPRPRSARMAATSGSPSAVATSSGVGAARCGAADDQPGGRPAVLGHHGGHPRRRGAGPHVRRHDQDGESAAPSATTAASVG